MNNFDDMTLEELQQLLQINTKDPEQVKRIQQLAGLTGNSVDGIWGKQTNKAWNKYMDANQSEIEDNIDELQAHQNAMELGQTNPAVVDVVGYSNKLDEAQLARKEKIAQLQQQIDMVKERIARNERALTGKSYEDVNNNIAALEMKKINSSDPTMIWRWQQQRQDTNTANANTKANEAAKFANTVDMWLNTRFPENTAAREQMISNLNTAIRDGKNAGADVSALIDLKAKWEEMTYGNGARGSVNYGVGSETEQLSAQLKTTLANAKTSAELERFKNEHPELKSEQMSQIDIKIKHLQEKEKAAADERAFRAWIKEKTGKDASVLSARTLQTYRNAWKNQRGK